MATVVLIDENGVESRFHGDRLVVVVQRSGDDEDEVDVCHHGCEGAEDVCELVDRAREGVQTYEIHRERSRLSMN